MSARTWRRAGAFGGGNFQVVILLSQRMLDRYKPEGH